MVKKVQEEENLDKRKQLTPKKSLRKRKGERNAYKKMRSSVL